MLARQEALRQKVSEDERGLMGGAGKLGELFKSAEASSGKSSSSGQQQNLGQLFKSAQSQQPAAVGKTHLSQKNLPNMATVEASPPSQVDICKRPFMC